MSTFTCTKHPRLLVKFSDRRKVRFEHGRVEVSGDLADRLEDFARRHPEYGIEVAEREQRETPKQRLQREAREHGLDDSGSVKELQERIARLEAQTDVDGDDEPDDEPEADDNDE